jgi:ribonuclease HI
MESISHTVPEAEVFGLRMGLRKSLEKEFYPIRWRGDNKGIIKQVSGQWRTSPRWNADHLRPHVMECIDLTYAINKRCGLRGPAKGTFEKRDKNKKADNVATYAVTKGNKTGNYTPLPAQIDKDDNALSADGIDYAEQDSIADMMRQEMEEEIPEDMAPFSIPRGFSPSHTSSLTPRSILSTDVANHDDTADGNTTNQDDDNDNYNGTDNDNDDDNNNNNDAEDEDNADDNTIQ